jgi:hypothetical protein
MELGMDSDRIRTDTNADPAWHLKFLTICGHQNLAYNDRQAIEA